MNNSENDTPTPLDHVDAEIARLRAALTDANFKLVELQDDLNQARRRALPPASDVAGSNEPIAYVCEADIRLLASQPDGTDMSIAPRPFPEYGMKFPLYAAPQESHGTTGLKHPEYAHGISDAELIKEAIEFCNVELDSYEGMEYDDDCEVCCQRSNTFIRELVERWQRKATASPVPNGVSVPRDRFLKLLEYSDAEYVPNSIFAEFRGYLANANPTPAPREKL